MNSVADSAFRGLLETGVEGWRWLSLHFRTFAICWGFEASMLTQVLLVVQCDIQWRRCYRYLGAVDGRGFERANWVMHLQCRECVLEKCGTEQFVQKAQHNPFVRCC